MRRFISMFIGALPFAVPVACFADAAPPPSYEVGSTGINTFAFFGIIAIVIIAAVVIIKAIKHKKGK